VEKGYGTHSFIILHRNPVKNYSRGKQSNDLLRIRFLLTQESTKIVSSRA